MRLVCGGEAESEVVTGQTRDRQSIYCAGAGFAPDDF